jgi:hypothetical protein
MSSIPGSNSSNIALLFTLLHKEANGVYEFEDAIIQSNARLERVRRTSSPGVVVAHLNVSERPIDSLRKIAEREPWRFNSLLKVSLVRRELSYNTYAESIDQVSEDIKEEIGDLKYRITLRRIANLDIRKAIINEFGARLGGKVDLENYEYELKIYYIDGKLMLVYPAKSSEVALQNYRLSREL